MKRTLLQSAACVAVVALAVPLATAGGKENTSNPNLSIDVAPSPVQWPKLVTVTGRLEPPDNVGKTIELQANQHPYTGPFKAVDTTTTDEEGVYTFTYQPSEHTLLRVRTTDVDPEQVSGQVSARSRMKITRRVSNRTPSDNETITFSGRVGPAHPGLVVSIQRRRPSGTWKTLATTRLGPKLADETSAYSEDIQIKRDGVWRAKIGSDANHLGNRSRSVRIDVL